MKTYRLISVTQGQVSEAIKNEVCGIKRKGTQYANVLESQGRNSRWIGGAPRVRGKTIHMVESVVFKEWLVGYGMIDAILVHAMADFFLVLASLTWTDKFV